MAEKAEKTKKVELRDIVRAELAQMIMKSRKMVTIDRTREGLVLRETSDNGERVDLIVRVIQKKAVIETADIVETIAIEEVDGTVEEVDEEYELNIDWDV